MAVIQKEIELAGSKGKVRKIAFFDSGSTYSYIYSDLARKLGIIESLPEVIDLRTAKEGESLKTKERVSLDFHIDGYRFSELRLI